MARRRLHGATQKKRKKALTRALKRRESVNRVQATQQPAPFERKGELLGQDITFLEAMQEMGVRRSSRAAEAPARQETFRKISAAAAQDEQATFRDAMDSLQVLPLGPRGRAKGLGGKPGAPGRRAKGGPAPAPPEPAPPGPVSPSPGGGRSLAPPPAAARAGATPPPAADPQAGARERPPPRTEFRMEGDESALLAAVLEHGGWEPAQKYEGAQPPARPGTTERPDMAGEPDAELDLHGKTQEEAIGMVQNFLLTAKRQRLRRVLLITGKGANSGQRGPVLRDAVNSWLERNGSQFASRYGPAAREQGGQGAIMVVIR